MPLREDVQTQQGQVAGRGALSPGVSPRPAPDGGRGDGRHPHRGRADACAG